MGQPLLFWLYNLPLPLTHALTFPQVRAPSGILPSSAALLEVPALDWGVGWDSSPLAHSEHYGEGPTLHPAQCIKAER